MSNVVNIKFVMKFDPSLTLPRAERPTFIYYSTFIFSMLFVRELGDWGAKDHVETTSRSLSRIVHLFH